MWNGTMFVDLDWPLNASSLLSASAELLVIKCSYAVTSVTWAQDRNITDGSLPVDSRLKSSDFVWLSMETWSTLHLSQNKLNWCRSVLSWQHRYQFSFTLIMVYTGFLEASIGKPLGLLEEVFLQVGGHSWQPANSVKALKAEMHILILLL